MSLADTLQEMLDVCKERDTLAQQVSDLQSQLAEQKQELEKQTIKQDSEAAARIDQIVTELFAQAEASPGPVGPLVKASIAVLEAAKILLESCQRRL